MGQNNQTITTLHNLLGYDACKFSSGEVQLKVILPDWIGKASSLKLKEVLHRYLGYVQQHAEKLANFIESEELLCLSAGNGVMRAFIEETEEKLGACTDSEVKDACLLASIQEINHFKISSYGTAAAFSRVLGMEKQAQIFHEAEVNEKQIDDRLSQLAEFEINARAKMPITLPG
jgi:ferritin-like metal-binding protein YciE